MPRTSHGQAGVLVQVRTREAVEHHRRRRISGIYNLPSTPGVPPGVPVAVDVGTPLVGVPVGVGRDVPVPIGVAVDVPVAGDVPVAVDVGTPVVALPVGVTVGVRPGPLVAVGTPVPVAVARGPVVYSICKSGAASAAVS